MISEFRTIIPIIKREWLSYFRSPVAYVFIIIFLISTTGTTWNLGNFFQSNEATLRIFFFFHPWLYLILIPAVGMRLWAEDKRQGTIEILLTLPVPLYVAVLGKFLAAWLFIGLTLALTFPMVFTVGYLGDPDGGTIVTGYIGSFLMAGAYLAISCFTSSLTKNQVISFITSFIICLVLVLLGWGVLTRNLNDFFSGPFSAETAVWLSDLVTQFSFTTHFNSIRRGLIDSRDVIYFLSIIGFMLLGNILVLENSKSS